MKLIIGLGNPGKEYTGTRHNVGFAVLDALVDAYGERWQVKGKFKAEIAELIIDARPVLLVKPQTFYNDSGQAAVAVKDFYKIASQDILAIHDELALPFGTIRTRENGSDAGNNGVKSLSQHLGTDYARIRIGIEQTDRRASDTDFVLGKFSLTEQAVLPDIISTSHKIIADFVSDIFEPTSYQIN